MLANIHSILLIEDQTLIAQGIAALLPASYSISFARNLLDMEAALECAKFDLALLDMKMKDNHSGVRYMERLQDKCTPVLIVASAINDVELLRCFEMGALGYVCKDDCRQFLQDAILAALAGKAIWTEQEKSRINLFKSGLPEVPKRFLKVLPHLLTNPNFADQTIADQAGLSLRTVKNYISTLLEIYGVADRYQLKNHLDKMGYTPNLLPN